MNDQTAEQHSVTVLDVIRGVFRNFPEFAKTHLTGARPPALIVTVWLLGMDAVAGAMELEFVQRGDYIVDNWFHAWLRIMGIGILLGTVRYWVVGTLFHGIVRLAGGHGAMRTSRYIFLYASVPVVVVDLSFKVFQMLHYGNRYFTGQTNEILDGIMAGIMLAVYIYSVRLCYIGMCLLMGADRLRSVVLIVVIMLAMFGVVAAVAM